MAGVRLEWAQFGDFDGFDVLRSDTPMDINALPSPIATNLPTMFYVDTSVVESVTYYYRVVAWRDGVSKVSTEIKVKAVKLKYRYWRILITADNGKDGYTELQEIELALTLGGADVTTPSTPADQSSYLVSANRPAYNLVDNDFFNINRLWTSAENQPWPRWVSFDLGSELEIAELRMWSTYDIGYGDWSDRAPKDFVVQGSNDNATWDSVQEFSGISDWQRGVVRSFNLLDGTFT